MIKQADIGVGIRGVEGTSAVASADYAISQFRFLTRLLLVYGHLNYRRMALLVLYIFYKSSILVWTVFFLGAYSMYSGQSLYMDWTFQLYNVAYTALPILIIAVLDRDLDMDFLEAHPILYSATRGDTYLNAGVIARWLLAGLVDSALCCFITWYAYDVAPVARNGDTVGFAALGLVIFTCVVMVVNVKLAFFVRSWTYLHSFAFVLSIVVYWCATLAFNASSFFSIGGLDYSGVLSHVASQPRFWLVLLLCIGSSSILNLLYLTVYEVFWPSTPVHVYYEAARLHVNVSSLDADFVMTQNRAQAQIEQQVHAKSGQKTISAPRSAEMIRVRATRMQAPRPLEPPNDQSPEPEPMSPVLVLSQLPLAYDG